MAIAPDTRALTTRDAAAARPSRRRGRADPRIQPQRVLALPGARPRAAAVIVVIPLVWNVYLTFTEYRGIRPPEWIGLDN